MKKQSKSTIKYEKIVGDLKSLGLTEYESKVFLELYKKSPQIAKRISANSGVSSGRIYEVLRNLREEGLVIEQPARGTSNLYQVASFPECLETLKNRKVQALENAYSSLIDELEAIERERDASLEEESFFVIKGERALDYYIKKLMAEAQARVLTNFTADLLLKYGTTFLDLQQRGIICTFVLSDQELQQEGVENIVKGGEAYTLDVTGMPNPLTTVLKDVRPTMLIVDDRIGIIIFFQHTKDGLLVNNPSLLRYQKFILEIFIQGGNKREFD